MTPSIEIECGRKREVYKSAQERILKSRSLDEIWVAKQEMIFFEDHHVPTCPACAAWLAEFRRRMGEL